MTATMMTMIMMLIIMLMIMTKLPFMEQTVSCRPLTAEARVRSQVSPCWICGVQSGTGIGFSPTYSLFPYQYHSSVAVHLHMSGG
jgi:hypothetical protein